MTARPKQRPVLRPLARLTGRDAVWQTIRELAAEQGTFTRHDILCRVDGGVDLVAEHIRRLMLAGIVEQVKAPEPRARAVYRLVRDLGIEAPRVLADGRIDTEPTDFERMWQAMKALPTFSVADLLISTGLPSEKAVKSYVGHLHRAGYLAVSEAASTAGRRARYRLLGSRNTGPRPPSVRKDKLHSVFDHNLGRQVWPEVAR